jgi:conjugal transfer pilin signal peptidase TrbI
MPLEASPSSRRTRRFLLFAPLVSLLVLGAMLYAGSRFVVTINDQVAKCLPPYRVFLVDRHNRRVERGGLYAFFAGERMAPLFPLERLVIKRVVGGPGDHVSVSSAATTVNGKRVGEGLDLARTLGQPQGHYTRELDLAQDDLWIMGATRDSFDSRYWGPLPSHQIIGRAYALF